MDYFEETLYYQRDNFSLFPKNILAEVEKNVDQYLAASKQENELVFTDIYLYENIDKILKTPNLTYILINFSNTPLQEDIFVKLAQIKTLCKLELSFISSDLTEIPEAIFDITSLRILHISHSQTTELSSSLGKLKNLESLTFIQGNITTLPKSIGKLEKLETLEVELNGITHLPSTIGDLKNITHINLFLNHLTKLPQSIGKLHKLKELNLSLMPSLKEIPDELVNLQRENSFLKIIIDTV